MPTSDITKVGSLRLFPGANCAVSSTVVMYPLHSGMGVLLVGDGAGVGVGPGVGEEDVGVGVGRVKGVAGAQAPRSRARPAQAATVVVRVRVAVMVFQDVLGSLDSFLKQSVAEPWLSTLGAGVPSSSVNVPAWGA